MDNYNSTPRVVLVKVCGCFYMFLYTEGSDAFTITLDRLTALNLSVFLGIDIQYTDTKPETNG